MSNGIITFASNAKCVEQAILLAITAKANSHLPVTLVTPTNLNVNEQYFNSVIKIKPTDVLERSLLDTLTITPYTNTLFLYSDTLVLSDISDIFDNLLYSPVVFNRTLLDFKGLPITKQLYSDRKIILKNGLKDIWSNAILYKNIDEFNEFILLAHRIITYWDTFKEQFLTEYSIDDNLKFKFNIVLCLAQKLSDISVSQGFNITTLSRQEENTIHYNWAKMNWYKFLNSWILDSGQVKVENFIQHGIWHYTSTWMTDEIYQRLIKVYNA
jgi:hypothetical protein